MTRFELRSAPDRHDELWRAIHAWPKVDLHRHLEGSLRLATLLAIAREHQIPVPAEDLEQLRPHVQMVEADAASANIFMGKFRALRHFFRSPEIIRRVTFEAVEDAAADNVRHLELRFTPHALARHNSASYEEVIACVCDAAAQAGQQFRIGVRLIISVNRHESLTIAAQTVAAGVGFVGNGIVGLDLAGLEMGHSALPFQPVFEQARAAGLALTIHAGEWDGPQNIREAVTLERIASATACGSSRMTGWWSWCGRRACRWNCARRATCKRAPCAVWRTTRSSGCLSRASASRSTRTTRR